MSIQKFWRGSTVIWQKVLENFMISSGDKLCEEDVFIFQQEVASAYTAQSRNTKASVRLIILETGLTYIPQKVCGELLKE